MMRPDQQLQNGKQQPVGNLAAKLPVHVVGDKETAAQFGRHGSPNFHQMLLQIHGLDLMQVRKGSRWFKSHDYINRTLREKQRHRQHIRPAEWIEIGSGPSRLSTELLFLKCNQPADEVRSAPGLVKALAVS